MSIEARLSSLDIQLPKAEPSAVCPICVITGRLLYVPGSGPTPVDGKLPKGKLGREFTTEQGRMFARAAGLEVLALVKHQLGCLDRVVRVVKLQGFVNATPEFEEHSLVIAGCSDLMMEVFGDAGRHARSVFGATSLRANLPIIVDSIFEIVPE
jgi:enamine deaminase RidA (YjgF/YER057c/UK114 family)